MGKKELTNTISLNLYPLVEWYFNESFRGENRKYEPLMLDLLSADKHFLKPVLKLVSSKKRHNDIPEGLNIMLWDYAEKMRGRISERFETALAEGESREQVTEKFKDAHEFLAKLETIVKDITNITAKKTIKKLMKIGLTEQYAQQLANHIVPKEYLNKHNVRKYIYRLNRALYEVQKESVVPDNGKGDNYVVNTGVSLAQKDFKILEAIYGLALRGADQETVNNALVGIALEKRNVLDSFNPPQRALFANISAFVQDILEGRVVFAPGVRLDKMSKKEYKKAVKTFTFGKKDLKAFFNAYRVERRKDVKRNRDGVRRIQFDAINVEEYPRTTKMYEKIIKGDSKAFLQSTERERSVLNESTQAPKAAETKKETESKKSPAKKK